MSGLAPDEPGAVGQILVDGSWHDYARSFEAEARRWQAADPTVRRVKHWITDEIIVAPTTTLYR